MKCEMSIMPVSQSVRSAAQQKNLSFSNFPFSMFVTCRFPGSDSQISSYSVWGGIPTPQTSGLRDFIRNTRQTGNLSSLRLGWKTQVGSRPCTPTPIMLRMVKAEGLPCRTMNGNFPLKRWSYFSFDVGRQGLISPLAR